VIGNRNPFIFGDLLSDRNRNSQGFSKGKETEEIKKAGPETGLLDEKLFSWIPSCTGMTENKMRNALLGQIHFHGLVNANIQAGEADHALFRIVRDLPCLSIDIQSARGTDGHAGRTAGAFLLEMLDLLGQGFDGHSLLLQIIEGKRKLTFLTAEFHNHPALFSRIDAGPEDVDHKAIVFDETIGDRLFHIARRK
jgi:hypothetical protein